MEEKKGQRGFASMDRVKQREISSRGGKAVHQKGTAHKWTSKEAREAGRKGGQTTHSRYRRTEPEVAASPDAPESKDEGAFNLSKIVK